MTSYAVEYTDCAVSDLENIYQYYAETLGLSGYAYDFFENLETQLELLESAPKKYPCCQPIKWRDRGLRVMPISGCVIYYIPRLSDQTIAVIRILFPIDFLRTDNDSPGEV